MTICESVEISKFFHGKVQICLFLFVDILYAVYEDGCIVKCATCTNPCTVLDEWACPDPKSKWDQCIFNAFISCMRSNSVTLRFQFSQNG
jgi:uncharacterized membrane protein YobD (UPF0266 family)